MEAPTAGPSPQAQEPPVTSDGMHIAMDVSMPAPDPVPMEVVTVAVSTYKDWRKAFLNGKALTMFGAADIERRYGELADEVQLKDPKKEELWATKLVEEWENGKAKMQKRLAAKNSAQKAIKGTVRQARPKGKTKKKPQPRKTKSKRAPTPKAKPKQSIQPESEENKKRNAIKKMSEFWCGLIVMNEALYDHFYAEV